MGEKKYIFLEDSWSRCEEMINSIGMKNIESVRKKIGNEKWENLTYFLEELGFIGDNNFTDVGEEYYKSKYIKNDEEFAQKILFNTLIKYPPTQVICQILWGRPNLTRKNIYRLLVLKEFINSNTFKEETLGGYLMLLNSVKVINYNKKTNAIRIQFNPGNVEIPSLDTIFLSPDTPYSNVKKLREIIRVSSKYIYWFDKQFSSIGFDPLIDEVDGNNVNEIKILTSIQGNSINSKLKSEFERFNEEMKNREVETELRVICDKELYNSIHDRWLISKKIIYNIPPVNTIYRGQFSEFKKTENEPPFEDWWAKGLDLVKQWQEINKFQNVNLV